MSKTLTAHEQPLNKVFSSDYNFRIPSYQRAYRWGTDEALQLLDDLTETLERGDDSEPYFLGSLVLVEEGETSFDVIDGQQRLTTLTILFAVVRDLLAGSEFSRDLAAVVMEPGSRLNAIPARPRLTLREQDAEYFRKYVQEPGNVAGLIALSDATAASEPLRAIRDNASALRRRLASWSTDALESLATLASTRTYLVVVSTPNLDSAYRIFSVMNARGLDLTPADIFKSRVIGSLPENSGYDRKWENAEESLGSTEFTDLFRDLRTVVSGERARRELLVEFPKQVLNDYLDKYRGREFIDDLVLPYARAYEGTISLEFGPGAGWAPVNAWLERLSMIDNKDWRPAALWAMVNHREDPAFLSGFLRRLERLAASFLLQQAYTTPRLARYIELINELKAGHGLDAPSFELSDEERRLSREALRGDVYRMQPRRARYVLLRLDDLMAKGPGVTYNHAIISIEHVLPQNPKVGSAWLDAFTEEDRQQLTHKLGNLLLLNHRKNSQANNYEFDVKKKRYFTTSTGSAVFALTTQVLQFDAWTPDVIRQRQAELTAMLANEWELN